MTAWAGSSKKHGTDILHFFVRKAMTNEGVESNAVGRVDVKQNQQGNANNQKLNIFVQGLSSNTVYQLMALLDQDTNYTQVAEFNTDANGAIALKYQKNGNGNGQGKGKSPLPQLLDPVSEIRSLAIGNSSTQAVLVANLVDPDKLQYLVKRHLSNGVAPATLRIKATIHQTQFRLIAGGLNPTNDYLLAFNGEVVQTNSTDTAGDLEIFSLLQTPTDILSVRDLALWDSGSNSVLSTKLP
jgi:hypothetical protein